MIRNVTAAHNPAEYLRSFSVGPTNVLSWFAQDESRRHGSTRTSGQHGVLEPAVEPKLPRYLRRRALQAGPTHSVDTKYLPKTTPDARRPSQPVRKFRSRHYDPSQQEAKSEVRLLEPHVLSARLKKCCDAGNLDEAVAMLKNAPLDAQNTPVWNTLIWECMKVKRFQLGYQLFIDVMSLFHILWYHFSKRMYQMKRRGFSPTTRTFQTMFNGLSKIEHWATHPKQLANARSLYDGFQRHIATVKKHDPTSSEISSNPLASYLKILGAAGQYQGVFDVYYAMDTEGPFAANEYIFTAMFQALSTSAFASTDQGGAKTAGDARLLWMQMLKASNKTPGFSIDSYSVVAAITALSSGRKTDQDLAFQIVKEYFGLATGEDNSSAGRLPLGAESLAAILRLCNRAQRYSACLDFFKQVKRRPEDTGGVSVLDRAHIEEVLRALFLSEEPGLAYRSLDTLEWMLRQEITGHNGPKIRPAISTYNLVLAACWRGVDWNSATRTFELMTGYHCHDFMDGSLADPPRLDKRAPGRNLAPTAESLSSMVRTAFASKNRANMRQCLRIVDFLGLRDLWHLGGVESKKSLKHHAFYLTKLATALVEMVDYVLKGNRKQASSEKEFIQWNALAEEARRLADKNHTSLIPMREVGTVPVRFQPERTGKKALGRSVNPVD